MERVAARAARPDPAEVEARLGRVIASVLAALAAAGCGGGDHARTQTHAGPPPPDPSAVPRPIGRSPLHRPPSLTPATRSGRPVAGMRCKRGATKRFGVHLELFAARRVVVVASGIGIALPRRERGAYVSGGRCSYPIRTREPTGVLEVEAGRRLTLGDLFALWGQPLSRTRMAGFDGRVAAFVGGRPRRGDPRTIHLERHAQIVLEVGGHVPPHASYRFPPGL